MYLVIADGCGADEFGESTTPFKGGVVGGGGVKVVVLVVSRFFRCFFEDLERAELEVIGVIKEHIIYFSTQEQIKTKKNTST